RGQCSNLDGEFKLDTYCSSVPDSKCVSNDHVGCVDGSNDLYSFDSCGNSEGVKQNCNYPSAKCGADLNDQNNNGNKEEFVCRNLNCENTYDNPLLTNDGGTRLNGEAWCEYPSATGPGLDLPGSIHYKHYCINGVEYAETCGNNRDEYCTYVEFTDMNNLGEDNFLSGLPDMSVAQCVSNRADDCSQQKNNKTCMDKSLRDCAWTSGKCLPLVPIGFTAQDREDGFAQQTCAAASSKIKVLWQGELQEDGSWKWHCEDNCEAFDGNTLKATNFLCMAQGDCGATPNTAGEFTSAGYWRNCFSGMVHDKGVKPRCISLISEGLWNAYYGNLIKTPGLGLNFGSVDAKEDVLLFGKPFQTLPTLTGGIIIVALLVLVALFINPLILLIYLIPIPVEKQKVKKLKIWCSPYDIPQGGDDCWKCSAPISQGGLLPDKNGNILQGYDCQPYTCETLGTLCKFLGDTVDGIPTCVKAECRNVLPPIIKPDLDLLSSGNSDCCTSSSDQFECSNLDCGITDKGTNVGYDINGNVNEFKTFTFGIRTFDETGAPLYTKCAYSDELINPITEEGTPIDVMSQMDSLSNGLASTKHNLTIPAGYLASSTQKEFTYYIRCKTAIEDSCNSVSSPTDYTVKFKVHTGPDTTAPLIEYVEPELGYVANDKNEKQVTLKLNEVITWNDILQSTGGCKWSTESLDYNSMTNQMQCDEPSINEQQECSVDITNLQQGENKLYFTCSDAAGNKMSQAYPYTLTRTDALNVSAFVISDDCMQGAEINCYTNSVTIKAETLGGAESGKSKCYLSNNCEGCKDIPFFKTDSTSHEQVLDS
ncbi:MAG: hypothetical protein KJ559_01325, partial [Nanoarchaeota archaeon]|nr:hypothetical protein [Nanoarchaeota archaeon]